MGLRLPKELRRALTAPELLVPGQIPKAPAIKPRTDGHWAADRLAGALVPVNGVMHDVANGAQMTRTSALSRYVDGSYAPEYDSTNSDTLPQDSMYPYWRLNDPAGFTLIVVFDLDTASNYSIVAGRINSAFSSGWNLRLGNSLATTDIGWYSAGSGLKTYRAGTSSNKYSAGTTGNFIAVTRADDQVDTAPTFYTNTTTIAGAALAGTGTGAQTSVSTNQLKLGQRVDGVEKLDGAVKMVLAFDRELSEAEVRAIQADPYIWAAPINDAYYFPTAAAPPSTTIPVFMHHYSQMRAR